MYVCKKIIPPFAEEYTFCFIQLVNNDNISICVLQQP